MVIAMIEKKDPNQKTIEDDFTDDDPIIELTDEVIIKPEEDHKAASPKTDDFTPPRVDKDPSIGDDEGFIIFEEKPTSSLQNDPFTEADGQSTDDVFIMDNGQDEVDGDSTAIIDDDAIEMTGDKTRNNFDDDIEIDYQIDEDEIDFFDGDDDHHEVSKHAGLLDPSGLKNKDFLELFDIEEEGPMEDEPAIENNAPQPVEKFSELDTDLDLAMAAAALSSGPGKIDRPDTPFPQDPTNEKEMASLPKDQSEKDDPMQKDSPASEAGDSAVVSPGQVDQAIERIINEKLAGRIEHIIYEIIEKTVKSEIDRLKASLLEDSTSEDNL
jgi:hypothetical protein